MRPQDAIGSLTPKLVKVIHTLEWVRIEAFVEGAWCGVGRRPHDRVALASAFVAKAVLGIGTTAGLIERLHMDRALRRICGFPLWKKLPNEATFSRVFEEFACTQVAERVHEALVKAHLGDALVGHISRDGTAIEAREKPARIARPTAPATPPQIKRGRPRKEDEARAPVLTRIAQQLTQRLAEMRSALPTACDRGTKCNAQGYKLYLDMV